MMFEELVSVANDMLKGTSVVVKPYGPATIVRCYSSNGTHLMLELKMYDSSAKCYNLEIAVRSKNLVCSCDKTQEDMEYILEQLFTVRKIEAEKQIQERIKKQEASRLLKEQEKRELEAKKAEEKFERAKATAIARFNTMVNETYHVDTDRDLYYYTIGWLAKNIRTVSARLPDYLDKVFTEHFGADVPRTVVDTGRRTVSGFKPQWSYSFTASVKNIDKATALVIEKLNESGTKIANTTFVWNLIDNHNFKFGKTQDVEEIKKTIPDCYMRSFQQGFSCLNT